MYLLIYNVYKVEHKYRMVILILLYIRVYTHTYEHKHRDHPDTPIIYNNYQTCMTWALLSRE